MGNFLERAASLMFGWKNLQEVIISLDIEHTPSEHLIAVWMLFHKISTAET